VIVRARMLAVIMFQAIEGTRRRTAGDVTIEALYSECLKMVSTTSTAFLMVL
jgi:hypothetical protein